jgi:transposase
MMPGIKERRPLTVEERTTLEKLKRSQTTESRLVERAKMVLWSREGVSGRQIAERLGREPDTVYRQLDRFDEEGLSGLKDRPRPGRPHEYDERERGQIIATARTSPQALDLEFGYWSLDRLVEYVNVELGIAIGRSQLHRVLQAEGLRWYQEKTYFTERPDPQFAEKRGP